MKKIAICLLQIAKTVHENVKVIGFVLRMRLCLLFARLSISAKGLPGIREKNGGLSKSSTTLRAPPPLSKLAETFPKNTLGKGVKLVLVKSKMLR